MIALDTNLLVYAHRTRTPQHPFARRAIEEAAGSGRGWGVSLACVAEFWSVVTHPESERPSTGAEASSFLAALVRDGEAQVWLPRTGFEHRLMRVAADLQLDGPRIYDLQIALTAAEAGASEMWTHDRNFVSVPGLRVHDPLGGPVDY